MLENSIYSVISPEGCASILWRDSNKFLEAAEAMKLSAVDLLKHGIIDEVISEPIGGAHRDKDLVLANIRNSLTKHLNEFKNFSREEIFGHRKTKFLKIGREKGFASSIQKKDGLVAKQKIFSIFIKLLLKNKYIVTIILLFIFGLFILI